VKNILIIKTKTKMKKIYKFMMAIALMVVGFNSIAQAPVPDLIHYKFNGTGSLVTNYASSPPVGTATGTMLGAITQTGGINCLNAGVGSGVSASTDYLSTGWTTSLTTSWSISFWCQNISTNATLYYIFGDNTANSFRCFTNGVAGSTNWILRGGGLTDIFANGAALATPKMVTFVYDQPNNVALSYIDGVLSSTVTQGAVNVSGTGVTPFKVLGYATNVGAPVGGALADFRVYGSALTATQVAAVYAATSLAAISVSVSGNTSSCAGQTVALTASGANSYTWNTASTNTTIVVSPTVSSSYTVIGASGTCTNSAVSSISVNALPSISVNSGAICAGNSFTLSPSGATSYTYSSGPVVTPTANASYTVTGIAAGCSGNAVASVTVNANPTVTAVSSLSLICNGQTASLTASGASTYSWNTSATTSVVAVSPSVTTSYTVTGTNTNSCSASVVITQSVSACTGLNNNVASTIGTVVYPNPNTGLFIIELNNGSVKTIEVMDLTGRIVLTNTSSNDKMDFNINSLSNGVYFVKVQSNNSVEVIKIVKQ
jgi:hypothetical protein